MMSSQSTPSRTETRDSQCVRYQTRRVPRRVRSARCKRERCECRLDRATEHSSAQMNSLVRDKRFTHTRSASSARALRCDGEREGEGKRKGTSWGGETAQLRGVNAFNSRGQNSPDVITPFVVPQPSPPPLFCRIKPRIPHVPRQTVNRKQVASA